MEPTDPQVNPLNQTPTPQENNTPNDVGAQPAQAQPVAQDQTSGQPNLNVSGPGVVINPSVSGASPQPAQQSAPTITSNVPDVQPSAVQGQAGRVDAPVQAFAGGEVQTNVQNIAQAEQNVPVVSQTSTGQQPVVGGVSSAGQPPVKPSTSSPKRKIIWGAAIAVLVVLLLSGAFVFGYYLPNRPTAVYAKAMSRSGDAVDLLVQEVNAQTEKSYKSTHVEAAFSAKEGSTVLDGTADVKFSQTGFAGTAKANVMGQKMSAELRGVDVPESESPDIYVKVDGLAAYSAYLGAELTDKLNAQWVLIDHTLVDSAQSSVTGSPAESTPTPQQLNDAMQKMQVVNKKYLFSDDKEAAVFTYSTFVGKETKDGRSVNHYKVTVSKASLKAYIDALGKSLDASKLNDWAQKQYKKNISEVVDFAAAKAEVDNLKDNESFDLYVDLKTKLMQSIAYSDKKDDGGTATVAISQNCTGGDVYPFELSIKTAGGEQGDFSAVVGAVANKKGNSMKLTIDAHGTEEDVSSTYKLTVNVTPSNDVLKVEAPSGARSFNDIITEVQNSYYEGVLGAKTSIPNVGILEQLGLR